MWFMVVKLNRSRSCEQPIDLGPLDLCELLGRVRILRCERLPLLSLLLRVAAAPSGAFPVCHTGPSGGMFEPKRTDVRLQLGRNLGAGGLGGARPVRRFCDASPAVSCDEVPRVSTEFLAECVFS